MSGETGPAMARMELLQRLADKARFDDRNPKVAIPLYKELVELNRRLRHPEDPDAVEARDYLAQTLHDAGETEEAIRVGRQTLTLLCDRRDDIALGIRHEVAAWEYYIGNIEQARTDFRQNLESCKGTRFEESTMRWLAKLGVNVNEASAGSSTSKLDATKSSRPSANAPIKHTSDSLLAERYDKDDIQATAHRRSKSAKGEPKLQSDLSDNTDFLNKAGPRGSFLSSDRLINNYTTGSGRLGFICSQVDEDPGKENAGVAKWISELEKSHKLVTAARERGNGKAVKVAIIDTGIDGTNSVFHVDKRIKAYKSWVHPKEDEGRSQGFQKGWLREHCKDEDGHGTHGAAMLMRVDPYANLYIARVSTGRTPECDLVVDAMEHAIRKWEVDVISVAIGFRYVSQKLSNAVLEAARKRVLVLAAASNDGDRLMQPISYPARDDTVICVSAATYHGKPMDGNHTTDARNPYAILGQDVRSAWTKKNATIDQPHSTEKIQSGSSVATSIAAGVASLCIGFARHGSQDPRIGQALLACDRHLKSKTGMEHVFNEMSKDVRGFRCIQPLEIFGEESGWSLPQRHAENKILEAMRKAQYMPPDK